MINVACVTVKNRIVAVPVGQKLNFVYADCHVDLAPVRGKVRFSHQSR